MTDYHEGIRSDIDVLRRICRELRREDIAQERVIADLLRRVTALESATLAVCPACGGSGKNFTREDGLQPCKLCGGKGEASWDKVGSWDIGESDAATEQIQERLIPGCVVGEQAPDEYAPVGLRENVGEEELTPIADIDAALAKESYDP